MGTGLVNIKPQVESKTAKQQNCRLAATTRRSQCNDVKKVIPQWARRPIRRVADGEWNGFVEMFKH